jgi:hypothetical protein
MGYEKNSKLNNMLTIAIKIASMILFIIKTSADF